MIIGVNCGTVVVVVQTVSVVRPKNVLRSECSDYLQYSVVYCWRLAEALRVVRCHPVKYKYIPVPGIYIYINLGSMVKWTSKFIALLQENRLFGTCHRVSRTSQSGGVLILPCSLLRPK